MCQKKKTPTKATTTTNLETFKTKSVSAGIPSTKSNKYVRSLVLKPWQDGMQEKLASSNIIVSSIPDIVIGWKFNSLWLSFFHSDVSHLIKDRVSAVT